MRIILLPRNAKNLMIDSECNTVGDSGSQKLRADNGHFQNPLYPNKDIQSFTADGERVGFLQVTNKTGEFKY